MDLCLGPRTVVDPEVAVSMVVDCEAQIARLQAEQLTWLVAAASGHPRVEEVLVLDPVTDCERTIRIADAVREEVACALRMSPVTAQQRIDTARLLAGPLAATRDALARGQVTMAHVNAITEAAARLDGAWEADGPNAEAFMESCAALESRVLPVARRATPGLTRAAAGRPPAAPATSGSSTSPTESACCSPAWPPSTPTPSSPPSTTTPRRTTRRPSARPAPRRWPTSCWATARPTSTSTSSSTWPPCCACARTPPPCTDPAPSPPTRPETSSRPCPPDAQVTLRRLVADPLTGHLLDAGRRSYRIPDPLRAFITARDHTCRFPGCARRAGSCQVDHATAWDDGGATSRANLGALCTRHHQVKTHAGWQITASATDGACTWASPHGRTYPHAPPDIRGSG